MPFVAKWRHGHRFNVLFLCTLLAAAAILGRMAAVEDNRDETYLAAKEQSLRNAERMHQLVTERGIPPSGAAALLRDDAYTQGPKLFAKNCASCHRFDGHDGMGHKPLTTHTVRTNETWASIAEFRFMKLEHLRELNKTIPGTLKPDDKIIAQVRPWAPDLKGFASREWLVGLFDPARVDGAHYFGGTKFKDGKMVKWVKKNATPEKAEDLKKVIAALSAEAKLKAQVGADKADAELIKQGRALIVGDLMACTDCHSYAKKYPDSIAPDLTGYGSRAWLMRFISNPAHTDFYGKRNDRMPAFADKKILDAKQIGLLADWLRGEWYVPPKNGEGKK